LRYGQILLALIGVAACYVLYPLGTALFDRTVGLWACFLGAVNPLWVLLAAVPMTESVAILLYPLFVLSSLKLLRAPTVRNAVVVGLVLGVTALNKATILGVAPFWLLWLGFAMAPRWRQSILMGGIVAALSLGILLPWTIRNYRLFGRIIPVTLQAGHSMYEANNPYTDYALQRVERGETWLNDPRYGQPLTGLSMLEVEDKGRELALRFIRENPARFVDNAWRRLKVFWMPYNHPAHRAYWYVVGPSFALGFFLAWRYRFGRWGELLIPSLLIVETMSLVILFPSMPRYRVPAEPFVLVFAAYFVVLIARHVEQRLALPHQ
jgi:4-amino-4-deoxy-L-arabinose transferase-like glycosyltransferase